MTNFEGLFSEAGFRGCSAKKVFLEIPQIRMNFATFLRTPFFTEHLQ